MLALFTGLMLAACLTGCVKEKVVVVYTAQDQVYAEPVFAEFTRQSGVRVLPLFDSEAVKTVGLANRLMAEQAHPNCDVFWGNEELRARQLAAKGLFQSNGVALFGYRTRRLVVNTNRLAMAEAPGSLAELTNAVWRGKVALSSPMFGTTSTHFLALRQHWGPERWQAWCQALQANQPFVVDGNSVVVKLVGRGEALVGLTDSDDIAAGQREGLPIAAGPMDSETLVIPNAVGLTQGAPHPAEARQLFDYLQREEVALSLIQVHALEGARATGLPGITVDWQLLLREMETSETALRKIFLR
jgi:iron(III) transport system substrate-binding protein